MPWSSSTRRGVDHRDIKPSNLGVRESRGDRAKHLVLFDFSLTRAAASATSARHPALPRPFPRRRGRDRYDSAAERYAAAVVLFEMATGRPPAYGDGQADPASITDEARVDPADVRPVAPRPARRLLHPRPGPRGHSAPRHGRVDAQPVAGHLRPTPRPRPTRARRAGQAAPPSTPRSSSRGSPPRALSALEPLRRSPPWASSPPSTPCGSTGCRASRTRPAYEIKHRAQSMARRGSDARPPAGRPRPTPPRRATRMSSPTCCSAPSARGHRRTARGARPWCSLDAARRHREPRRQCRPGRAGGRVHPAGDPRLGSANCCPNCSGAGRLQTQARTLLEPDGARRRRAARRTRRRGHLRRARPPPAEPHGRPSRRLRRWPGPSRRGAAALHLDRRAEVARADAPTRHRGVAGCAGATGGPVLVAAEHDLLDVAETARRRGRRARGRGGHHRHRRVVPAPRGRATARRSSSPPPSRPPPAPTTRTAAPRRRTDWPRSRPGSRSTPAPRRRRAAPPRPQPARALQIAFARLRPRRSSSAPDELRDRVRSRFPDLPRCHVIPTSTPSCGRPGSGWSSTSTRRAYAPPRPVGRHHRVGDSRAHHVLATRTALTGPGAVGARSGQPSPPLVPRPRGARRPARTARPTCRAPVSTPSNVDLTGILLERPARHRRRGWAAVGGGARRGCRGARLAARRGPAALVRARWPPSRRRSNELSPRQVTARWSCSTEASPLARYDDIGLLSRWIRPVDPAPHGDVAGPAPVVAATTAPSSTAGPCPSPRRASTWRSTTTGSMPPRGDRNPRLLR